MNFHSASYGIFLLVVLTLFWLVWNRRGLRSAILLVASYFFYGSWNPLFLILIAFSTLLDYNCGRVIADASSPRVRKAALLVSLVGNLGLLGFFKYYDWGIETLQWLSARIGVHFPLETLGIIVPVGISFYTFQTLSYTIDIYRGVLKPARNLLDFSLFVAFFPQLVAGPIVRAVEFLPQLELKPRFDRERMNDGLYRIALGVGKKVVIADVMGRYLVDMVYARPEEFTPGMHLLALYAFTFQIYFDFSGYSDIAIGSARLFGFDLPENFDLPFRSRSVREFWRRWHISLSSWVRDYVYFPLGGSRRSEPRVAFNLIFTMFLIGLWHGASWLWVIYGLLQGVVMCIERGLERLRGREFATTTARNAFAWFMTFHFTVLSLVCVRAQTLGEATGILSRFGARTEVSPYALAALVFAAVAQFMPPAIHGVIHRRAIALPAPAAGAIFGLVVGFSAFVLVGETPYIYFQF